MTQPSDNPTGPDTPSGQQNPPKPSGTSTPEGTTAPAAPTAPSADAPADGSGTRPAPRTPETRRGDSAPAGSTTTEPARSGGRGAVLWISLILGAIVLVLLLIFVIQNSQQASFEYFNATFDLPLGVAMLFAAIAGALVMALVGSVRMVQMSWTIRKMRKQQEKTQRASR